MHLCTQRESSFISFSEPTHRFDNRKFPDRKRREGRGGVKNKGTWKIVSLPFCLLFGRVYVYVSVYNTSRFR